MSGAPYGYLQLTDASIDQAGAVLFDTAIPATQGLRVTFEQWQYGSTTAGIAPADGIAFFLVDGEAALTGPGAFGGSLGYAQKRPDGVPTNPVIPGVDRGYLGIGLDVLGNYFGDWEDRSLGCPPDQVSPAGTAFRIPERDKITVRGPGDPADPTLGYCFLTSTAANLDDPSASAWPSTLPVSLQGVTAAMPVGISAQGADDLLGPDRRTIDVVVTPAPDPRVTVSIAGADGVLHQVLDFPAPQPVPESYKFGFSASTGLFTDVHLVRNVVVESVAPAPILTLTKAPDAPGPYRLGEVISYTYVVTNSGLAPVEGVAVVDDKVADVVCDATTLSAASEAPLNVTTCRGRYVVTSDDVAAGQVTNVATATGQEGGAVSPPVTATVPVVAATPGPEPTSTAPGTAAPAPVSSGPDEIAATGASLHAVGVAAGTFLLCGAALAVASSNRRRRSSAQDPR
ncbi:hypothetical protein ACFRCR_13145 [Oerskovia sp. NPDC056781]|uniref:DUF7507 domain-containing protein n=1 Tax=Oerskovia sp. NPDC056781 TaxID=3345942 RepID=UPI00366B001A